MSLLIKTPPTVEPVTVDELKAHLRLTTTDDDLMLARHIVAARESAERITRRSLVSKVYLASFDRFPCPGEPLRLPVPPLISVAQITFLDSALDPQVWDAAEYFVAANQDPALIIPKPPANVYPAPASVPGSVEVTFTAGYSSSGRPIPEHLRLAIMQLAGHYYDHPEVVGADPANEVPQGLMSLLMSNRIYVF